MQVDYQMGWLAEFEPARMDALVAGKLDMDDIVLLYQDLIEAGLFPAVWRERGVYMVNMGLIHIVGRALH